MRLLNKRSQFIGYAASGMGINLLNTIMGSYLCSALLIGGFGEAVIPFQTYLSKDLIIPAVWAIFVLVSKIVDGIIDIPMASFADNFKSRFGRRRPVILIGMLATLVSYYLFLLIPDHGGASFLNTCYYGIVLCLFYISYTLTMVTYYATFTEIVDNIDARNVISNTKSVFDIIYFIVGYVGVRAMLNGLNIRTVALMISPIALTMLIPLFMIKDEKDTSRGNAEKVESVSLVKSLVVTFKDKDYILWMIVYSIMTFGVQLFLGGINEYFSFTGMNMIAIMLAAFIPVPFTLKLYNNLIKKHGFGYAYRYTLISFGVGMLALFFVGYSSLAGIARTICAIAAGLICALAIGAMFAVAYSIPSELAAEHSNENGISNSAMYFAVQGLFSGVASGLATGVVLTALKGSETNPTNAMTYMTLICAGAMALALVLTLVLPKKIMDLGKENN